MFKFNVSIAIFHFHNKYEIHLQVVVGQEHLSPHKCDKAGAYEWWYFDFIDEKNEYSAVVIFLIGSPFSPDNSIAVHKAQTDPSVAAPNPFDFCSVSVNIYLKGRVIYRTLLEFGKGDYAQYEDSNVIRVRIGNSEMTYNKNSGSYSIEIIQSSERYKDKLRAEMTFTPVVKVDKLPMKNKKSDHSHFWMPTAPLCNVNVKIVSYADFRRKKTEVNGLGYADHNWGSEPLFKGIKDWFWGRVVSDDHCLIYYYTIYEGNAREKDFRNVLLFEKNRLLYRSEEFPIEVSRSMNYWMLGYGGTVKGNWDDLSFKCTNEENVDSGPFYVRSLSTFIAEYKGKKIFDKSLGFSEYICPKRLHSSFLKHFVKLRIKRLTPEL